MATKIGLEIIKQINELYSIHGTYAEVARQLHISPSTVKKYVDKFYVPEKDRVVNHFNIYIDLPEFSTEKFVGVENYGDLCELSPEEAVEIHNLWEELDI